MAGYQTLLAAYGEQHWWPADTAFEMMIGAILTQNTSWRQVETAIAQLKAADCLTPQAILACQPERLQALIRPSGFFRQKSERLVTISAFYLQHGGVDGLRPRPLATLRKMLLDLHGIGAETADCMLLYVLDKPVFVIDTYTRRLTHRLGWLPESVDAYDAVQAFFQQHLEASVPLFQEFHALIVQHAKQHCLKKPRCTACPLAEHCLRSHHGT
ncbi:MAG: endonuclease III domain-containing protein [Mariprofundaceae bacterium]|nr:endonuclease III domain-containing protein [Mariprofundaceae bacterium]